MNWRMQTLIFQTILVFIPAQLSISQESDEENICSNYSGNVIIPNPNDCFSFYACQHGYAMKIICPVNSMFNPKLGNCDEKYSGCVKSEDPSVPIVFTDQKELMSEDMSDNGNGFDHKDNSLSNGTVTESITTALDSTTLTTSVSTQSTTNAVTENPENCVTPTEKNSNQCPFNDTDIPTFMANDSFCDSFYLCYHGRPFEMYCSVGFHWNQELNECIPERQSKCTDSTVGRKVPRCPSTGQHFFPHSERCNYFYYCENGIRSIQQCTAFKHWDINERTCKIDIVARCIQTVPKSLRAKYFIVKG